MRPLAVIALALFASTPQNAPPPPSAHPRAPGTTELPLLPNLPPPPPTADK